MLGRRGERRIDQRKRRRGEEYSIRYNSKIYNSSICIIYNKICIII